MKKIFFIPCFVFSLVQVNAQKTPLQALVDSKERTSFAAVNLLTPAAVSSFSKTLQRFVRSYKLFHTDDVTMNSIIKHTPEYMELVLPLDGETEVLQLVKSAVAVPGAAFTTGGSSGDSSLHLPVYKEGVYYRGIVKGKGRSLVAISFFEQDIIGVISTEKGNYVLGKTNTKIAGRNEYILYNEKDLLTKSPFHCDVPSNSAVPEYNAPAREMLGSVSADPNKCVRVYVECDYALYQSLGNDITNVNNFVTGLFNIVSTIYQNEYINLTVSGIKIWTRTDPYAAGVTTREVLDSFSSAMVGGFNGDLAHLCSGRKIGGGFAWINRLCSTPDLRTGVSGNLDNTITPLPTYSWNANVITHELGHNLGSYHTHDCVWNGNNTAIDGCGPAAGKMSEWGPPCPALPLPPANSGTIMSYCHQNVGINLSLGFGPQPGDVIRKRVANAQCLGICTPASCPYDVTITGNYGTALTTSATWIRSAGQTVIVNTAKVKLDANPFNGYIELKPMTNTDYFIASPVSDGVFTAQAVDGCNATANSPAFAGTFSSGSMNIGTDKSTYEIFPNPSKGTFVLRSKNSLKGTTFSLFNMLGQIQPVIVADNSDLSKTINCSGVSKGTYMLKISAPGREEVIRVIIL